MQAFYRRICQGNYFKHFTKLIMVEYLKERVHYVCKNASETNNRIRSLLIKQTLFLNQ